MRILLPPGGDKGARTVTARGLQNPNSACALEKKMMRRSAAMSLVIPTTEADTMASYKALMSVIAITLIGLAHASDRRFLAQTAPYAYGETHAAANNYAPAYAPRIFLASTLRSLSTAYGYSSSPSYSYSPLPSPPSYSLASTAYAPPRSLSTAYGYSPAGSYSPPSYSPPSYSPHRRSLASTAEFGIYFYDSTGRTAQPSSPTPYVSSHAAGYGGYASISAYGRLTAYGGYV
jgi:hypothetical protein